LFLVQCTTSTYDGTPFSLFSTLVRFSLNSRLLPLAKVTEEVVRADQVSAVVQVETGILPVCFGFFSLSFLCLVLTSRCKCAATGCGGNGYINGGAGGSGEHGWFSFQFFGPIPAPHGWFPCYQVVVEEVVAVIMVRVFFPLLLRRLGKYFLSFILGGVGATSNGYGILTAQNGGRSSFGFPLGKFSLC
jgi:hypothetical protein